MVSYEILCRKIKDLLKQFSYYIKEAKDKIKKVFNNALIIIDMFHINQLISRCLNKARIKVMKRY